MLVSSTNRTGYTQLPSNKIPYYNPSQPYRGEYADLFTSEEAKPKRSFLKKCLIGTGIVLAGLAAVTLAIWFAPKQLGERLKQGFSLLKDKSATLLESFPRVQSALSHFGSTIMGFFKRP